MVRGTSQTQKHNFLCTKPRLGRCWPQCRDRIRYHCGRGDVGNCWRHHSANRTCTDFADTMLMLHDLHALSQPPSLNSASSNHLVSCGQRRHGTKDKTVKMWLRTSQLRPRRQAKPFVQFFFLSYFFPPCHFFLLAWRARKHPGKTGCQADT